MIENFIDTALSVISGVRILDIVDIAIVAFAIYQPDPGQAVGEGAVVSHRYHAFIQYF